MVGYAGVLVLHRDSVLLVQQRDFFSPRRLGWTFPSGRIEPNERPADAAVRELYEETGCRLDQSSMALIATSTNTHKGEELSTSWNYTATVTDPMLHPVQDPDEDVVATEWVPIAEAQRRLATNDYSPIREPALHFLRTQRLGMRWTFAIVDIDQQPPEFTWSAPTPLPT